MNSKTFQEVAELWQEDKKLYVKRSTFAAYSFLIHKHLLTAFRDETELTEEKIQNFVLAKLSEGLKQKSIKDILIVLKMILKFGEKHGCMKHLAFDVKFPTEREKYEIEVLSKANQKKLMEFTKKNFTFQNLGIYICLCSVMRIGEICALKWEDIDIVSSVIRVNKTIQRIYNINESKPHTEIIIDLPKSKDSIRQIPISNELMRMVKPLKKVVNNDFYVISNSEHPIEPLTYRNHYLKIIGQLNVPHLKFHGLRHSFATRCIESGCDYKTVSTLLGHSNISTTLNLYVHPNMEQKRKCIDKMFKSLK